MVSIGTNSIRVYHVDPSSSHDGCMSAFSDAGIYVWLDLDTFSTQIVQTAPAWTEAQFLAFALVMDEFQKYDNLAGFWIGNEVITTLDGSPAGPYIKAATTDMKAYMKMKNYRHIPIGYSAADIAELRPGLQNYLACGSDPDQSIDFFGLNSYEWCGVNTYEASGYKYLQNISYGYSIPIFFSETGCNSGGERTFADQVAIFGPDMAGTWSGAIIYEWVQETNDYGLVTYPNGQIYSGAPIPIQPDFDNIQNQWKSISPSGVASAAYHPSFSAPACPASTAGGWQINGNPPIPTLGSDAISAAAASSIKPSTTPIPTPTQGPTTTNSNPASTTSSSTGTERAVLGPDSTSSSSPTSIMSSTSSSESESPEAATLNMSLITTLIETGTMSSSTTMSGSTRSASAVNAAQSSSSSSSKAAGARATGNPIAPVVGGAAMMVLGWLV